MWIHISKYKTRLPKSLFVISWLRQKRVTESLGESWGVSGNPREAWGHAIFSFFFSEDWSFRCRCSGVIEEMHGMAKLSGILTPPAPLSQVPLAPYPQPRHLRPVLSVADEGTRLLHQSSDQRPSHPICR